MDLLMLLAGVFVAVTCAVVLGFLLPGRRNQQAESRIRELAGDTSAAPKNVFGKLIMRALPNLGKRLLPKENEERQHLLDSLCHAGLYDPRVLPVFLLVKALALWVPLGLTMIVFALGILAPGKVVLWGSIATFVGYAGPRMWLDQRKKKRQRNFRKSLPDAMDVIVICIEGGLSLPGAIRRVVKELWNVHPMLADELAIVEQEVLLGRTTGEALAQCARRTDLEEMRSLASLVTQADQFGTSMVKALVIYSDALRLKRQQHAEEVAQKASTKIMFPTLLFIFPAVFVVILGPAAIQVMRLMGPH